MSEMDKNVGGIGRTGRIVIGVVVAIAGIAALTGVIVASLSSSELYFS